MKFFQRPLNIDYKLLLKVKESLTFEEVHTLLSACETIEEKALIELALNTGIRRNDIVDIEIDRIDIERSRIAFWEEKKDRYWMVALSPEVVQTLKMYINTLPRSQKLLFEFSGRTAYNILQRLMMKARIKKHIPFHGLRRSFVRLSRRMGRDVRFVMDQTGDSARVILEAYEGYTVDEMVDMMADDNILRRSEKLVGLAS
jgi:integrase/recombinase XerD